MKRRFVLKGTGLLAATLAGGAGPAAAQGRPIVIGYQEQPDWLLFVARDFKLFEKAGLQPTFIKFGGGPQMVEEMRAGRLDLASVGSVSPYIGLFGTVWGIMEALKGISAAGSASLETVAGPIGAALVATGVGIAVAVPAVLVYNYFLRRLKLTAADLDDFAHDFYSLAQKSAFRVLVHPALHKAATVSGQPVKEAS